MTKAAKIFWLVLLGCGVAEAWTLKLPVRPAPRTSARVTLAWDESAGTDIAGYNVYQGPASRDYTNMVDAGCATNLTVPVPIGTNYFAATAYDSSGVESDFSEEAIWDGRFPAPLMNVVICVWGTPFESGAALAGAWRQERPLLWCATNPVEPVKFFRGRGLTITRTNF